MNADANPNGWRCMATLELDDSELSLATLNVILPGYARTHQRELSPIGYRWVDLLIHQGSAGTSSESAAGRVIASLELSSQIFPSFRIVEGSEWIEFVADRILGVEAHAHGAS
jgi:hypothetical protein